MLKKGLHSPAEVQHFYRLSGYLRRVKIPTVWKKKKINFGTIELHQSGQKKLRRSKTGRGWLRLTQFTKNYLSTYLVLSFFICLQSWSLRLVYGWWPVQTMTEPDHDTGSHLPYSMREMLEVFHVLTNQSAGDGTYGLSYEKTRISNHSQMS